ncbi:MAG TPA: hypothetical protein VN906_13185 [Candidatus Sulfotelmatobacter sp.]|nr:hypothetical protein [Candidatus Sulfotelmatobacter sp.]
MSALPQRATKIVRLPYRGQVHGDERTSGMALKLRGHLSLLQGYADIMEGVSPRLRAIILRVMAGKARELGTMLQPFTDTGRRPIGEYRQVRERTRQLMLDYRLLLERLHDTVAEAHDHLDDAGKKLNQP